MSKDRLTRVNELLRRAIGEALFHVMHEGAARFDLSAVTVTHVVTSVDLRRARVLVSIRDHQDQRDQMLALLRRHRPQIQRLLSEQVVLKYTPRLSFELDPSLEKGDHVLSLLAELDQGEESEGPTAPDPYTDVEADDEDEAGSGAETHTET